MVCMAASRWSKYLKEKKRIQLYLKWQESISDQNTAAFSLEGPTIHFSLWVLKEAVLYLGTGMGFPLCHRWSHAWQSLRAKLPLNKALVLEQVTLLVLQGHMLFSEWHYLLMAKAPIPILCWRSYLVQSHTTHFSCRINSFTAQQGQLISHCSITEGSNHLN